MCAHICMCVCMYAQLCVWVCVPMGAHVEAGEQCWRSSSERAHHLLLETEPLTKLEVHDFS